MLEVLRSRHLSLGPRVPAFEAGVRRPGGRAARERRLVRHGRRCTSRCAPWASRRATRSITSPFSFVARANSILYERARPVFVDIDPVTLNLDAGAAAAAVTERTTALLPVHIFGYPADMPALERHGLPIVEDACEALGAVHADGVGGRRPRPSRGVRLLRQQAAHDRRGRDAHAGLGGAQGARGLRAQPGPRAGHGLARPRPARLQLPADRHRVRARARAAAAARRHARRRARVAAGTGRRWPAVEGLELPCEDFGGDVRGWFVFVVQLPHGVRPRRHDPGAAASAASSPSPTCPRST